MARQIINTGTAPNDGAGDSLRVAAIKINENFDELYVHKNTLSTVATSGSYLDLINQPAIPADISDLTDTTGLLLTTIDQDYTVNQANTYSLGSAGLQLLNVYTTGVRSVGSPITIETDQQLQLVGQNGITITSQTDSLQITSADIQVTGPVTTSGAMTVGTNLTVNGHTVVDTAQVVGALTVDSVNVQSNLTVNGSINVAGSLPGFLSIVDLKALVAASIDFTDFQSRIAAL